LKFDGGRSAEQIQQWIWSHINPASQQLNSTSQVEDAIDDNAIVFLYVADSDVDGKDRDLRRYIDFSYTIRNTVFVHTTEKSIRKALDVPLGSNLVVFKNGNLKPAAHYQKMKLTVADLKTFVELNSMPRVLLFDDHAEFVNTKIFLKDKPAIFFFSANDKD
jgi:hypothetical protein